MRAMATGPERKTQTLTCACGFDGWTIFARTIQCVRCDAIYGFKGAIGWPENPIKAGQKMVKWDVECAVPAP